MLFGWRVVKHLKSNAIVYVKNGATVELVVWSKAATTITAADFPPAFVLIAVISAVSALIFARLPPDAGAELAHRTAPGEKA